MVDISKLGATKIKAGHYRVYHGATVYDIKKMLSGMWRLKKNSVCIGDFYTKRRATEYAWRCILAWQKENGQ